MVFNIHNGSYHRPRCSERSICSPWWLVSYRESFWSEVANPSTRSGKRNMSHCVIMASSLTTPVYMWVPPTSTHRLLLLPLLFLFHSALWVRYTTVCTRGCCWIFLMQDFCNRWARFSWCDYICHHCCRKLDCNHICTRCQQRLIAVCNVTAILANPGTLSLVLKNGVS